MPILTVFAIAFAAGSISIHSIHILWLFGKWLDIWNIVALPAATFCMEWMKMMLSMRPSMMEGNALKAKWGTTFGFVTIRMNWRVVIMGILSIRRPESSNKARFGNCNTLSRNRCLSAIIAAMVLCSGAMGDEPRHERLLKDFDWRLEQRSLSDRVTHTPEAQAVLDEGVAMLPSLIERFRGMEDARPFVKSNYAILIQRLSGISTYSYAPIPKRVGLIDFYDSDLENLPKYSYDVTDFSERDYQTEFLEYWDEIVAQDTPIKRIGVMHTITKGLDPLAEEMTEAHWRAYDRAMGSLGIFNLPIYIHQVAERDDPIAFAEFLRVTAHPVFLESSYRAIHTHIERVRESAAAFPKHRERLELIATWWEHRSSGFLVFPTLHAAIEESMRIMSE